MSKKFITQLEKNKLYDKWKDFYPLKEEKVFRRHLDMLTSMTDKDI